MRILVLLASALLILLAGLWSGLVRLPVSVPHPGFTFASLHGAFMVAGFLGTVISIERAAALGGTLPWLVPLVNGIGGLLLIAGSVIHHSGMQLVAAVILLAGSVGLALLYIPVIRKQTTLFHVEMACGAIALVIGNLQWLASGSVLAAIPGWFGFLLLTITGERLELNRLMRPSRTGKLWHWITLALFMCSLLPLPAFHNSLQLLFALCLLSFALWLLRHDLARRTIRIPGLPRYTAICLISGYVWLGVAALIHLLLDVPMAGLRHDAYIHAFMLGFVISMIFGHAPIILPALTGRLISAVNWFYVPLAVLHGSLAMRIAGDLLGSEYFRQMGGVLGVMAILSLPPLLLRLSSSSSR